MIFERFIPVKGTMVTPSATCSLGLTLYTEKDYARPGAQVIITQKEQMLVVGSVEFDKYGDEIVQVLASGRVYYARCRFLIAA